MNSLVPNLPWLRVIVMKTNKVRNIRIIDLPSAPLQKSKRQFHFMGTNDLFLGPLLGGGTEE